MIVEICVEGIASAIAAGVGGADRIELCENLAVGGVTPSLGTLAYAAQHVPSTIHALIRPRGGDFVYSRAELQVMTNDLELCQWQARGAVFGVLDESNRVNIAAMRALIKAARPKSITFHRAFDIVRDPIEALDTLIDLGVDRVLTSGRPGPARDSIDLLAKLVAHAGDRITILAGGSVTPGDLPALANAGIREAHIGSAACADGVCSQDRVAQIMAIARGLGV